MVLLQQLHHFHYIIAFSTPPPEPPRYLPQREGLILGGSRQCCVFGQEYKLPCPRDTFISTEDSGQGFIGRALRKGFGECQQVDWTPAAESLGRHCSQDEGSRWCLRGLFTDRTALAMGLGWSCGQGTERAAGKSKAGF